MFDNLPQEIVFMERMAPNDTISGCIYCVTASGANIHMAMKLAVLEVFTNALRRCAL
jgi:hypothetical protein